MNPKRPDFTALQHAYPRANRGPGLLPRCADVFRRCRLEVGSKRIDVDPAPAREARVDGESFRPAACRDVDKYLLHAGLVKRRVTAVGNKVAQQARAFDARTPISDEDVGVVRLAGHRAGRSK